ncbi:MAG: DUF4145 domain-containing protein [Stellaceae bacterium]
MPDEGSRDILRGHCPECDADRNAEVLAEDITEGTDGPSGVWFKSTYSILRCLGCDRRYIRRAELCSADWDSDFDPHTGETSITLNERVSYWPSVPTPRTTHRRPDWLLFDPLELFDPLGQEPRFRFASEYPELATLLHELYAALDNNLQILSTIGIRTVFDCASQLLGCHPNQSLPEKLKELTAGNKISGEEKEILSTLTDAGSAAAHRGWKPTQADINSLMEALEHFLHRTFVLKHELRRVKKNIPPRAVVN